MRPRTSHHAYSLIEVIVAGAILMISVAAVAAMALATVTQQESNVRISQAIGYQEQAARLYQLGLAPSTIVGILPEEAGVVLTFRNGVTTNIGGIYGIERIECDAVFRPNPHSSTWAEDSWVGGTTATRTNTMMVIRPTIR